MNTNGKHILLSALFNDVSLLISKDVVLKRGWDPAQDVILMEEKKSDKGANSIKNGQAE